MGWLDEWVPGSSGNGGGASGSFPGADYSPLTVSSWSYETLSPTIREFTAVSVTTVNLAVTITWYIPMVLSAPLAVVSGWWQNGGAVGGNSALAVYASGADGKPSTRLATTGSVANAGVSAIQSSACAVSLSVGVLYYLAFGIDGNGVQQYVTINEGADHAWGYPGVMQQAIATPPDPAVAVIWDGTITTRIPFCGVTGAAVI